MTGTPVDAHWHAYGYTGPRGYFPHHERDAPTDPASWLGRPASEIMATLSGPEDAEAWMRQQLAALPGAEGEPGYLSASLYLRENLYAAQSTTAWASYRDRHDRHVLRLLAACPQPSVRRYPWEKPPPSCPLGEPSP
ncbi:hypothetical protein [Streptomyces sp. W1SF4]|uniref:hypothetical protein n=1 Tax=Streptomyces sp. W1SF4 TaxID=2305220 RepID=UPI000F6F4244|nr:hypothetical protein [Streptomyces sp. W1SF4]AZM91421.1 hypothetical protein D1J60_25530 [Streptomyces sp. W1SF4]